MVQHARIVSIPWKAAILALILVCSWYGPVISRLNAEENLVASGKITRTGLSKGGIDNFPAFIQVELPKPADIDVVVCRWKHMPSDYVLEGWTGAKWRKLSSVVGNVVLGPRIKLHTFKPMRTARLRIKITATVGKDIHGRGAKGKNPCALTEIGVYAKGKLPGYIEKFLTRKTPCLVTTPEYLARVRKKKGYKPAPAWLKAEIPTWRPIPSSQYSGKEKGRIINTKANQRRSLLKNCAWAYAKTGDERYARKAREAMLAILDHHEKYQGFRFVGMGWKAVTFQEPAYMMHSMNTAYDLIAASECMTRRDKLRYVFFSLDNAEFQYRAIRDRFNGRENWSANSLGEIVLTAYYFRDFPDAGKWVEMTDRKVGGCFRPFMTDGFWWECSPSHAVYTLRGLCKYGTGKHLLGDPIWKKEYKGKSLESVLEALAKTFNPFGEYPSINDSYGIDNPLLAGHPEFRPALYLIGRGDLLEMMKDTGPPPVLPGAKIKAIKQADPPYRSVLLPDAGITVMRDGWRRDDAYLLLDFGPHGGWHGHLDKLSIIMFANGHRWIPDAGCAPHYCIFPEQRQWHKQTIAHNTVIVNDKSQKSCQGKLLLWKTDDKLDIVSAEHDKGYPGITHRRTIVHPRGGYFIIHDTLWTSKKESADLDWLLHVYGKVKSQGKGKLSFRNKKGDKGLLVLSDEIGAASVKIHKGLCGGLERDDWKSDGYPPKGKPGWIYIPYIRLHKKLDPQKGKKVDYFVVLYPFAGKEPAVKVRRIHDAKGRASGIVITHGRTEDLYVEASPDYDAESQGEYRCGGIRGKSGAVFVRLKGGRTIFRKRVSVSKEQP